MLQLSILAVITLITLLIASYTDIRTREVPDWISYGFLFAAIGIRAIFAVFDHSWQPLITGGIGFGITFVLAMLFYYTKQWGGADSKLLMGMGVAIGVTYPFDASSYHLLFFFLALLLFGALYGLAWIGSIALKNWHQFKKIFVQALQKQRTIHYICIALTLAFTVTSFIIPAFVPFTLFPLPCFYLLLLVTLVEQHFFTKPYPTRKLTEGDWLVEDVKQNEKTLLTKRTLNREDIVLLKQNHIKEVIIKEGIPFVPSFLLGYIATLLIQHSFIVFETIF